MRWGVLLRSISHGCVNKPEEQSIGVLFVCFLYPSLVGLLFPVVTKTNSSGHRSANLALNDIYPWWHKMGAICYLQNICSRLIDF